MANTKTLFRISAAVCFACATGACHPTLDLQGISAGFIKGRPSEIIVGNDVTHGWLREWDALYRDEEWHCVRPTWVKSSTSWVGTECRRMWKDPVPPSMWLSPNATSMRTVRGCTGATVPGAVPCDSPSDHQTSE
jgi:hypothetical protein